MITVALRSFGLSQETHETSTNLDVIRSLARQIAVAALEETKIDKSDSIELSISPAGSAWYIESSIAEGFQSLGFTVRQGAATPVAVEFGLNDVRVEYSNLRKDGLFGSKLLDRKVELRLTSKFTRRSTGSVIWSSENADSATDTIGLSEVSAIENPGIAITRGMVPREGFFSNFAEPLILLGAIAVAVFLLFNVRS